MKTVGVSFRLPPRSVDLLKAAVDAGRYPGRSAAVVACIDAHLGDGDPAAGETAPSDPAPVDGDGLVEALDPDTGETVRADPADTVTVLAPPGSGLIMLDAPGPVTETADAETAETGETVIEAGDTAVEIEIETETADDPAEAVDAGPVEAETVPAAPVEAPPPPPDPDATIPLAAVPPVPPGAPFNASAIHLLTRGRERQNAHAQDQSWFPDNRGEFVHGLHLAGDAVKVTLNCEITDPRYRDRGHRIAFHGAADFPGGHSNAVHALFDQWQAGRVRIDIEKPPSHNLYHFLAAAG